MRPVVFIASPRGVAALAAFVVASLSRHASRVLEFMRRTATPSSPPMRLAAHRCYLHSHRHSSQQRQRRQSKHAVTAARDMRRHRQRHARRRRHHRRRPRPSSRRKISRALAGPDAAGYPVARSPASRSTNLFGGVNGARSDGGHARLRRRGVIEHAGADQRAADQRLSISPDVDLASIPRDSIDRIEITRGNSGAVLVRRRRGRRRHQHRDQIGRRVETERRGSRAPSARFNYREGKASVSGSKGPWSASVYSNAINSDGYRDNNSYRQLNGVGDLRYTYEQGSALPEHCRPTIRIIGLPGARRGRAVRRTESNW